MARTSNSDSDDDENDEDEDENNDDDDDDDDDNDDTTFLAAPAADNLRASVFLKCVVAKETTTRSVQITRKTSGNVLFRRRASGVVFLTLASGVM